MSAETLIATPEQLRQVAWDKRKAGSRRVDDETGSGLSIEDQYFQVVEAFDDCDRCGNRFTWTTIAGVATRTRRTTCDRCVLEEREENRLALARAAAATAEERRQEREARLLDLLEDAGVNVAEHRDATLENFDMSECGKRPLQHAHRFLKETRQAGRHDSVHGLYLHGDTGTGKTHLAVGVLRELMLDPEFPADGVIYDHAAMLIARIQDTYNTKSSTLKLLDRRFNARVWILDDLGTERPSADVVQHLTLIFTMRAMRPTLVTSNLSPDEFEARRPELARVASRLGPGYFRVQPVGGRDRRFG